MLNNKLEMISFTFNGKTYYGETIKEIKKLLKKDKISVSDSLLKKSIKNTEQPITAYLINKKTKVTEKIDLRKDNRPLLRKKFNIPKEDYKKMNSSRFQNINDNFKISLIMPKNAKINIILNVNILFKISAEFRREPKTFNYQGPNNKKTIEKAIKNFIFQYLKKFPPGLVEEEEVKFEILDTIGKKSKVNFNFKDMVLRDSTPLKIFNEDIKNNIPPSGVNCVHHLLSNPKFRIKRKLKELPKEPTINDLEQFCIKNNINLKAYDINRHLIASNITSNNKNKVYLNVLTYNNHLYQFDNKFLNKTINKNLNFHYEEDINKKLIEFLNEGLAPSFCSNASDYADLSYFIINNEVYSNNKDYEIIKKISVKLGIFDKISFSTNIVSFSSILEKLYLKQDVGSNWFNSDHFIKGGFLYSQDIDEEELKVNLKNIKTIDKNKAYSYLLKNLPYLIKLDYTKNNIIESPSKIIDHFLYIIKVEESSLLLPSSGCYVGSVLKYAKKEGLKFTILEGIETLKIDNYYKELVEDLYKLTDPTTAKNIINRMVGKFNKGIEGEKEFYKFNKICNNDEAERTDGYKFKLNDEYNIFYKKEIIQGNTTTKKPISFQILDASRIMLYEKMKELNLKDEQILKIKTDSISFYKNSDLDEGLNLSNNFDDWKEEEFKIMGYTGFIDNIPPSFKTKIYNEEQKTILYTGDAGCGKTFKIINELIPTLDDYLILTPTNSTMSEYKKGGFNVSVKQKYTLSGTIPKEKNIIIDEVGMSDTADFKLLVKLVLSNRNLYAFGDFSQLLPINHETQLDKPFLINSIFQEHHKIKTNFRNNFTSKYYDDLRFNFNYNMLYNEVKKFNSSYLETDFIICYTNETRKKYNKLKMDHLGYESILNSGCRVICKSNDFRDLGIYNNFKFTVVSTTEETVEIKDEKEFYKINKDKFLKFFQPGYALTLYSVQGESLKNFFYPEEDFKFLDNRRAYTLISRLKR